MSRHSNCAYCKKLMRTGDMIKVGERILCPNDAINMIIDRVMKLEATVMKMNDFMAEKFSKPKGKGWGI